MFLRTVLRSVAAFGLALGSFAVASAQTTAGTQLWQRTTFSNTENLRIKASTYTAYELALPQLKPLLSAAPMEFTTVPVSEQLLVDLPGPDGQFIRFRVVKTQVMHPDLAKKYPNIITLAGNAVGDHSLSCRIDVTELGFHARIDGGSEPWHIDPAFAGNTGSYISYGKSAVSPKLFVEPKIEVPNGGRSSQIQRPTPAVCVGAALRQYRLAVACTGEYAVAATGLASPTVAQALSAIVTTVNRVTGVYEKEVAIRLQLIANNNLIVFTSASTDPFNGNNNANTLINESQTQITNRIGSGNFDIGHTFSTGAGGLAGLGVVCDNSQKASGVTGSTSPTGDPYDIDYVAHEVGHQFGGDHTFNASTDNCSGNGSTNTNVEPGSGTTIMAYAGICGTLNNIQNNSDPQFHAISYDEIINYTTAPNTGISCATIIATNNLPPVVNAGADYTIPVNTPFLMTGSATDPNGNALTYSWEQVNTGGNFGNYNAPTGNAPIFRSFPPEASSTRYFPRFNSVAANSLVKGELYPTYARTLNFRLTARDNVANGGGVCYDEAVVTVVNTGAPFSVTRPNVAGLSFRAGDYMLVTWDVAGTTGNNINTSQVNIELITGNGTVFTTVAAATPNDGNEQVLIPSTLSGSMRIRVSAVNNVFYDLNNFSSTITAVAPGVALSYPFAAGIFNDTVRTCTNGNQVFKLYNVPVGGYSGSSTISVSGTPAGASISFSKTTLAATDSTNVTVSTTGSLAPGTYTLTFPLNGTGGVSATRTVVLVVTDASNLVTSLVSPANNANTQPQRPVFVWNKNLFAETYQFQLAADTSFTNVLINATGLLDTSYTPGSNLTAATKYFWRVRSSSAACGGITGAFPVARSFTIAAFACDSIANTTAVSISAGAANTRTSVIAIPAGQGGTITSVKVGPVVITHTYISDLNISLIGPDQTTAQLIADVCDDNDDMNLSFEDGATASIACPPTNGAIVPPDSTLSRFTGKAPAGNWTLRIIDQETGDGGSLNRWSLKVCRSYNSALPIGWWNLSANRIGEHTVQLNWATRNELNTTRFEVEKSTDGRTFTNIGQVKAGGTTVQLTDYYFADAQAAEAVAYYRVKQVAADGRFTYSNVVMVKQGKGSQIQVLPNPASHQLLVRSAQPIQQLELFSSTGQRLYTARPQQMSTQIPVSNLANGQYSLRITTAEGTTTERVMVQH